MAATLAFSSVATAMGLDTYPAEPTEAEASIAGLTLGGNDLIGLAESHAGSVSNPGPNREAFSGSLGGTEIVDFGAGYTIPLDQLLQFGQVGALLSESTATDGRNGEAISGIAGADGGLTLEGQDGQFGTASIDLLSLFNAAGVGGVTDLAIDQADFTFGLGGAWVEAVDGAFQDPDQVGGMGQYRVGDAKIVLHSPVIEQAGAGISDAAGNLEQSATELVNSTLGLTSVIGTAVPGTTVDVSIETSLQQDVLDAVMLAPITTDDGLASIDLGAGTVTIDIGRLGGNDDGVIPNRPVGLNNQNPNTELIDSDTYPFVASSVHDVIEKVLEVATDTAFQSLQAMKVNVDLAAPDGTTAGWKMDLTGNVTDDFCNPGNPITGGATCLAINAVKATMGTVVAPLRALIADRNNPLYEAFTLVKTDLITVPVRAAVDPFLELIAQNIFSVQINHQETQVCTPPGGGPEALSGLEVSALSLGVAGGAARLGFGNAGVRVDACGLVAEVPSLTASSPVPAGGESTITSGGWQPNAEVSLQLTNAAGDPVGDPVVVTADAEGNLPDGTVVPVPDDAGAGDYTVVGTSGDDEASGPLVVYAPTLDAQSPVLPGDCSAITSSGWLPNSQVTLQLVDAAGGPVGDPVVVTTDAEGNVPADTCVPIPEGTDGDFEVVGTDENGAEVRDPVLVDGGAVPSIDASSPAPAGGETEVVSFGWLPNAEVTLQLTDADGNPVGDPVVVTANNVGQLPDGTVVPIPADTPAGGYTLVGTDADGNEASDEVVVYAPSLDAQSPVAPGDCSAITSGGWLPNSQVTLQLTDAAGNPVGDPVVVTTDAEGNVPDGTCVEIPEGTEPGDYEVVGTDDNGADVSDPVTVDENAIAPTLDASSPVPAGGETEVASGGWNPNSEVTLQLTGPLGTPVGEPVVVTTDAEGDVPAGTVIPVPADSPAGLYSVVGTDADGNEVSDVVSVYAPSLDAQSPVAPGDCSVITSGGWLPNTEVTLQLTDAAGNPVGDPVVVTTDAEGNVPDGTCVEIPEGTEPGEYEVVGTDDNGADVSDPVTVDENAIAPTLDASSPVPAGGETEIVSGGWAPDTEVSFQLTDGAGNPVGDPVVVTTDGDGNAPEGTSVPVPSGTEAGDYTVVGTDADGNEASDEVMVYAPTLDAESPVLPGDCSAITSGGWLPGTQVTLQLTDAAGNPVGDPVVVTTDAEGNVPAGTCVEIPEGTEPGDYEIVGTDDNGGEVSDPVTVGDDAAVDPSLTASSPVPAGGETVVTSGGWAPESEVSLQLTDGAGDPVGDPVVVTTDAEGNVPDGTSVPVPADAEAGDYTVVGTDADGNEASDEVAVYAPSISATSPVPVGGETEVTSAGWLPNTEVSLQLTNGAGDPVGDAVVVTTDAEGNVPEGTVIPVPADAVPGDHEVVGTDDNGAEVSAQVEVIAAAVAPTLDASSPVPAGGETEVVSGGWAPDTEVSLQLTDGAGNPVGDPVVVTTDAEGNVPEGTVIPVPTDAVAGDHSVVGTDDAGNEASDEILVYAPTLDAESPVLPGDCAAITSGGWLPNTSVTLQLIDGAGNAVGEPVVVTSDAEGDLPEGTCVEVPEGTEPGEHEVVGTDDNGAEVSDPLVVTAPNGPVCTDPKVTVTPSVASAGDTVTVTGTGFAAGTQATVQIFDKNGKGLLDPPLTVTVGADCGFTAQVKIPGNAGPGDHTVVVTDGDGNTGSDTLTIRKSPAGNGGPLVNTGAEMGLYGPLVLLLLAAGAAALIASRRTREIERHLNR